MPPTKVDLSSFVQDCDNTVNSARGFIDSAQRSLKAATDKTAKIMAPATLGASEASSAKKIFESVDEQQDELIANGLDPAKFCGKLLSYASTLAQSAKSRLIDANAASGG